MSRFDVPIEDGCDVSSEPKPAGIQRGGSLRASALSLDRRMDTVLCQKLRRRLFSSRKRSHSPARIEALFEILCRHKRTVILPISELFVRLGRRSSPQRPVALRKQRLLFI